VNYIFINHFQTEPLYRQLKKSIKKAILNGILKHGDPLPSEYELTFSFSISSTVVKKAYQALEKEKFIKRIQGKGTFVHAPHRISIPYPFPFFLHQPPFHTQTTAILIADETLLTLTYFEKSTPLLHLKQHIYSSHQLMGYQEAWIPYHHRAFLMHEDNQFQLKAFMLQALTIESQTIFSQANHEQAFHLGVEEGTPILLIHSTMKHQEKTIGFGITYLKGDHSQIEWEETQ